MKIAVLAIGAVLAMARGTQASFSQMEMQSQGWDFPLSPGMTGESFNELDTQGGTRVLKAVEVSIEGAIQAAITAENNSTIDANDFAVSITGIIDFNIENAPVGLALTADRGAMPPTATDHVGLSRGMGRGFAGFGLVFGDDRDNALVFSFPPPGLLPWMGHGADSDTITGSGGFAAQFSADATIDFDLFRDAENAKVAYFFDVIPTPGTVSLVGLAGIAAIRRRRN